MARFYIKYKWINKSINKKITKIIRDSMNHTRFLKEFILLDWARRDNQVTKGDRVECQW